MKYKFLIIDGNWLLHVILAVIKNDRDVNDYGLIPTFVKAFFRKLKKTTTEFEYDFCAISWDHPQGSALRKEIFASYKSGRVKPDGFKEAMLAAKSGIRHLDIIQVESVSGEGDDVIATMCRQFKPCLVWSADKDFLPLVNSHTHLYKVSSKKLITISNIEQLVLEKVSGFGPKEWRDYLVLRGDAADKIDGLKGVGPVTAMKILKKIGDFVDMVLSDKAQDHKDLEMIAAGHGGTYLKLAQQALRERDSIILANKLVALYKVPLEFDRTPADYDRFYRFLTQYSLSHLTEELYVD